LDQINKEGKFEKFMGFMQSDEGMGVRKSVADVTKTVAAVTPDKGAVMFKSHFLSLLFIKIF